MNRSVPIVCCAIWLWTLEPGQATPGARNSVAWLSNTADAIVIGAVDAHSPFSHSPVITIEATVHITRVRKGPLAAGTTLSLSWELPPGVRRSSNTATAKLQSYGIFFLARKPAGRWSVLWVYEGSPMWDEAFLKIPAQSPPGLRAAVLASLPANASVVDTVLAEVVLAHESGVQVNINLIEEFRRSKSPFLESAFVRFQSNRDPHIRNLGIRGSLAAGDVGTLLAIQREHRTLASDDSLWQRLLDSLRLFVNTERRALWSLGLMASDEGSRIDLRSAAASALARMHTRDTLPLLAALLDDPSDELRAIACGGIARFANNLPMDSSQPASRYSPYRTWDTIIHATFESEHTPFWKAWWKEHKAELTK
ncbi:MAG: hypothetical protein JNL98_37110 [Bryobacterales bacterium]|nr:hypothetical protein [Bryobacterales bacterium]